LLRDVLPAGTALLGGRYRLDYALGRGGFGITYRGVHAALERVVAIKEFFPNQYALRDVATGGLAVRPGQHDAMNRALGRFTGEGRVLARLDHAGVVHVHDLFEERGTAYLVMDLLPGRTLRTELEASGGHLPEPRVRTIVGQLVDALGAIHDQGIYHLDIKPDNVLMATDGRPVLVDFGAARQGLGGGGSSQAYTEAYAPPELLAGQSVGPGSDLFELAMMAHELLLGSLPPGGLARLLNDTWVPPVGLLAPWPALLEPALHPRFMERPSDVRAWWAAGWGLPIGVAPPPVPKETNSGSLDLAALRAILEKEKTAPPPPRAGADVDMAALRGILDRWTAPEGKGVGLGPSGLKSAGRPATPSGPGASTAKGGPPPSRMPRSTALVVDQRGGGSHRTIAEAIQAAAAGERILIRPGVYREGVVVEKPLELVGEGKLGDIVLEVAGRDVVLFKAASGRVANLTLRQLGDGKWYAVDITQGRLELEGCDITSQSLAAVGIHGGADPILRGNRIHDGQSAGVFIYDHSRGLVEDNDIFANAGSNVSISEGSDPVLRGNRIHDGQSSGVFVYSQGRGTLENNDVYANGSTGIAIKEGADPILRNNRIYNGHQSGVHVYEKGRGTLEDNDIYANALAGVEIKEEADPVLRRNRIRDGEQAGVYVNEHGLGTLEENDISGNTYAGVAISEEANPRLARNRVHDGKQSGIYVYERGRGVLEDNDVFSNANSGVTIREGGDPILRGNRLFQNGYQAVRIDSGGRGTLENNDLRNNAGGAWSIDPDCEPNVSRMGNVE
jgi:parallel beta-helix repeat protein